MADLIASQKSNESQAVAAPPKKSEAQSDIPAFEDNRPEALKTRELQAMANGSSATNPPQDDFALVDRDGKDHTQKEEALKLDTKEHKEKLEALKAQGGAMGENKQIAMEGELTLSAKFNRFFNKESTYSIILRKSADFNKSTDIVEKQKLLQELKPLARNWLENHAQSKDANEPNEVKKRASLLKFLDQTTSNFPKVLKNITDFNERVTKSKDLKTDFNSLCDQYQLLKKDISDFKGTYPPSINLLYFEESKELEEALHRNNAVEVKTDDIDFTELGFKLTAVIARYSFENRWIKNRGNLTIKYSDSSKGLVEVEGEGNKKKFHIIEPISAVLKKGTLTINCSNFIFNDNNILICPQAYVAHKVFEKDINFKFTNIIIKQEDFDFDTIAAALDSVDFGVLSVTTPLLTYDKSKKHLSVNTTYAIDASKLPKEINDSTLNGTIDIQWDLEDDTKRFYKIAETSGDLKLLGQVLSLEKVNYESKEKKLEAKKATLKVSLDSFKGKELTVEDLKIDKDNNLSFSSISLDYKQDLEYGVLTLNSEKLVLKKKESDYIIAAQGKANINLPKNLQPAADLNIEGFVGVNLSNPSPFFELEKASASITVDNPIKELAKFLGDGWSKMRFDLGATIPVFPGISALFGVYIQLLAEMPDTITGTAQLKDKIVELDLSLKSVLNVEGGVYGGVQAGSQLLIALAVLLRAAAKIGIDLTVGYNKTFAVGEKEEKPDKELAKGADGLYYSLSGELKAGAYLDLVATAFYFFQKTFSLELKEWSLGKFEFSNKASLLPEGGKDSEFKEEDLRKEVTPGALLNAEVATMTAEQLLDQKQNERFSQKEKEEILTKITKAEEGRATQFNFARQEKDKQKKEGKVAEGSESLFNDVAAKNMHFMDQYVNKHVDWDGVVKETSTLGKLKAKQPTDENKAKVKKSLMVLKDKITIPASFKDHYALLVQQFEAAYAGSNSEATKNYIVYLKNKNEVLGPLHTFKVDVLHSQFWGDESQIDSNLRSWSVFGETKFEALTKQYDSLYDALHKYNANKKEADLSKVLKEMHEEHQNKLADSRAKAAKANTQNPPTT